MRILFLIFSMLVYSLLWSQDTTIEKELTVTKSSGGKTENTLKIISNIDGKEEVKVLKWVGEEMPDEIKGQLDGIHVDDIKNVRVNSKQEEGRVIVVQIDDDEIKRVKKDKHFEMMNSKGRHGRITQDVDLSDAYIGAHIRSVDTGVEVVELIKDGPADKAKLQKGDIVKQINGARTRTMEGMLQLLNYYEPNDKVEMIISRNGKEKKLNMTLGKRPEYQRM